MASVADLKDEPAWIQEFIDDQQKEAEAVAKEDPRIKKLLKFFPGELTVRPLLDEWTND